MTVYIDAVFILNWVINTLLLHAAARIRGSNIHSFRLFCSGALGAVYAVFCYLPRFYFLQTWTFKMLALVAMMVAAFGVRRQTIGSGLVFLLLALSLSGVVYFAATALMGVMIPIGGIYPVTFSELLLTAGLSYAGGRLVLERTAVRQRIVPLKLTCGEKTLRFSALHDTGNSLCDPISGDAAVVIAVDALRDVLGQEAVRAIRHQNLQLAMTLLSRYQPRLLPYRAVGTNHGLLLAIRCELTIGKRTVNHALVALSPTSVGDGGDYCALIGGNWDEHQNALSTYLSTARNYVHRRHGRASATTEVGRGTANTSTDGARR